MTGRCYAGVGSRETPLDVQARMTVLATWLASCGWTCRTGGATGADSAFMRGTPLAQLEHYAPWPNFRTEFTNVRPRAREAEPWARELAASLHPNWGACGGGARSLHSRNVHQVLGLRGELPSVFNLQRGEAEFRAFIEHFA